jgi:hypothetical protein
MITEYNPPKTAAEFASLLKSKVKISNSYAWELAAGVKRPSLEKAVEFERQYGIPISFWSGR